MSEWQPIETAPQLYGNAARIMVAVPDGAGSHIVGEAYQKRPGVWYWAGMHEDDWGASEIADMNYGNPTHWMPLPEPPR